MIRIELVCLANLTLIGLLPRLLFRPGKLNLAWWTTAAPLLANAALMLASVAGWLQPWNVAYAWVRLTAALFLSLGSVVMIASAVGSHRRRIAMWHQYYQQSSELVTWGPYARIRHPLYSAFQMTLIACALAFPHWTTLVAAAYGLMRFHSVAVREEQMLLKSELGSAYREYVTVTGRFVPRLRRTPGRGASTDDVMELIRTR